MSAIRTVIGGVVTFGLGIASGYLASRAWTEAE